MRGYCVAVRGRDRQWWKQLTTMADRIFRVMSLHPVLCCGIIGGIAGATLDLDHIPTWLFHIRYPVPIPIFRTNDLAQGRNLHGLALVGGWILCACSGGLILLLVLKPVDKARAMFNKIRAIISKDSSSPP